jgi:hypothetical protein
VEGWLARPAAQRGHGPPRKAQRPLTDLERPTLPAGVKEEGPQARMPYTLTTEGDSSPRKGGGGETQGEAAQAVGRRGTLRPLLGPRYAGRGAAAQRGEPRRGARALARQQRRELPTGRVSTAGFFAGFFLFFLFFARARGLPAKPYLARVCGGF